MASMNQGQKKAFGEVLDFLRDPNRKEHRLSGGPGTGKSFFISKVVLDILQVAGKDCGLDTIKVTATTNQAAAVLEAAIPEMEGEISTIYSAMNLRLAENWSTGETTIRPTRNWAVQDRTLFIIDEASMVNSVLMQYLMDGTTSKCKILYVGDKDQLNPVKESVSPVFSKNISESVLTQPVRNAEQPALMDLVSKARETVNTGKFFKIEAVPGVIDLVNGPQLKGVLERTYHEENHKKRILGYTNDTVIAYNEFCRELRGYEEPLVEGEIVVNNTAAELTYQDRLYTGQVLEVVEKRATRYEDTLLKDHSFKVFDLLVKDVVTGVAKEVTSFADPIERTKLIKRLAGMKAWERYFRVKNKFPDLRHTSASTTHKAQGSTYDEVIVDLNDISDCTNKDQTARLLYVALSRPKHRIYVRGELDERYFE